MYLINGKRILAIGGAASQDKSMRVQGISWWTEELWSKKEEDNAIDNLKLHNWEVDFVVAHTCPDFLGEHILSTHYDPEGFRGKSNDPVSKIFTTLIEEGLTFKEWHFGHWHEDEIYKQFQKDGKFSYQSHFLKEPFELKDDKED